MERTSRFGRNKSDASRSVDSSNARDVKIQKGPDVARRLKGDLFIE